MKGNSYGSLVNSALQHRYGGETDDLASGLFVPVERGGGGASWVVSGDGHFEEPITSEAVREGRGKRGWAEVFMNRPQFDVHKIVRREKMSHR